MICSTSTGKSGSKWLDRLRLSKGFPTGADLDLDHFLNHPNTHFSNSPDTELSCADIAPKLDSSSSAEPIDEPVIDGNITAEASRPENGEDEWFGVVSDVLAELFCIGDSNGVVSRRNEKKGCRKQPNPRICLLPAPSLVVDEISNRPRRAGGDSVTSRLKRKRMGGSSSSRVLKNEESVDVADDEKSPPSDLSGFSRTDVTVIDTSCQAWKCEKLLFRKKNVWRVRDSKRKNKIFGKKKKRKANMIELENSGREKKLQHCSSSRDGNEEQIIAL